MCHKSQELKKSLQDVYSDLYLVPPHYTGLLQPCDVEINKSLKDRLKKKASDWRRNKHTEIAVGDKLPAPKRADVLGWLMNRWHEFPIEIAKNSFRGCCYVLEEGIDCGIETDSESEKE